jgi:glycosyltransferase involved in cell wall biosynthesis
MMAIAKYLPRAGFDLTICSLRSNGQEEIQPILNELGVRSFVARFRPRHHTPRHFVESLRDQALIDRHGPFEIQHSLDFTASPFEATIARMKARYYVYHQRNMNEEGSAALLRMKIRLSNRIIAVSDPVKEMLLKLGATAGKLRSISNGIDLEDAEKHLIKRSSNPHPVILSVGHVVRRKRHEDAIQALSVLTKDLPQLRLWIAGNNFDRAYQQELQDLVLRLHLADKVEFLGVRRDILLLMQQADVLVHCAESEGFGWVILEAMTAGLPVVSSSVEGPRDIIEDGRTGFLVPIGKTSGYVQAIRSILMNREVSERIAKTARETVAMKFSAKSKMEQLAVIYRELVG